MRNKPDPVWLQVSEVVALTGEDKSTITRKISAQKYIGRRRSDDGRAPWEVALSSLPESAQRKYAAERVDELRSGMVAIVEPSARQLADQSEAGSLSPEDYRLIWERYDQKSNKLKEKARAALEMVMAFDELSRQGLKFEVITGEVCKRFGASKSTLWRYRAKVDGHPQVHWEPLLAPQYVGGGKEAPFSEEAYLWILNRYLTTSEPNAKRIIKDARKLADGQGWSIPSNKTVMRRINAEPAPLVIAGRQGLKALERSFPTADKDYSAVRVHQRWQSDGRRADILCRWPDGTVRRPFIVVWMDERSRMVLSVKGYLNPCTELTVASYRMAVERTQRVPERIKIDNGREYANKTFTGGQKTRYRFKVVQGEQIGVITRGGTGVDWSPPGKGRDKMLESWWNRMAEGVDKAPEFEGAYPGKDPVSKPDNFDPKERAVPIAVYAAKLAMVCDEYNRTEGHRGHGMNGRSPLQVMTDLLPESQASAPDPVRLRQMLMFSKVLKLDAKDASIRLTFPGYGVLRFTARALMDLPLSERLNRDFQVYADLENPDAAIAVYDRCEDRWICDAHPMNRIPAIETGDRPMSTAHAKERGGYVKENKSALKALRRSAPALLPDLQGAELSALPQAESADNLVEIRGREPEPERPHPVTDPLPGEPGARVVRETGQIIRRVPLALPGDAAREEPKRALPPKKNLFEGWGEDAPQKKTS